MRLQLSNPPILPMHTDTASPAAATAPLMPWGAGLLAAALSVVVSPARADAPPEKAQISFKYLDYQDSQPEFDRIRVKATAMGLSIPIAGDWSLDGTHVADVISGASPAFYTATRSFSNITERRTATDINLTKFWPSGSLRVGFAASNESDYQSRALSALASLSSEDRNTTLKWGLGVTKDRIGSNIDPTFSDEKSTVDALLGVTQVITPNDIAQVTLTYANGQGFFSDPYKALDSRPRSRQTSTLLARWNHFFAGSEGTARISYRYYTDTNQINAHTLGLEYEQGLPNGWSITPLLRLYSQSAAKFYVDPNPKAPTRVNIPSDYVPGESLLSFDQRTSAFGARTVGLKISKDFDADWSADLKLEHYEQRAEWRWSGNGSPDLAPFRAVTWQLGVARRF